MTDIDFQKLYQLQDAVLGLVFSEPSDLYLTGGTCLHRFILEKRLSEDLDFFANDSSLFYQQVRASLDRISQKHELQLEVEHKDFFRARVDGRLQIDFVNDHAAYLGSVELRGALRCDNVLNILSNKLTAIMGRDDPKDVFDFYMICSFFSFSWDTIISSALDKFHFSLDDLIVRLESFPESLLKRLRILDASFLDQALSSKGRLISEMLNGADHEAFLES